MRKNIQIGFTLVELMISLVLGLLISAAALQIFYVSSLSSNIQQAGSNLVDNNVFNVDRLLKEVRKTGLGSQPSKTMGAYFQNHETPQGGVVLTAPKSAEKDSTKAGFDLDKYNLRGILNGTAVVDAKLLSNAESGNSASNIKGIANSDQLTIQYKVAEDNQVDCMSRNVKKGDYVIERFFLRNDTNYGLSLSCAAAIYTLDNSKLEKNPVEPIDITKYAKPEDKAGTANGTSNLAGNGEIIAQNVDYFRVLLGITDSKNFATDPSTLKLKYIPIPKPSEISTVLKDKRIVSIRIGLLLRSAKSTKASATKYTILDKKDIELNDSVVQDGKIRNVLENTVLIRNARGTIR